MTIAKTSKNGFNVSSCADNQLLFSSDFPTLPIKYSGTFSIDITADRDIFTHNMGFAPVFMIFVSSSTRPGDPDNAFSNKSGFMPHTFACNGTKLMYVDDGAASGTLTGTYYIFDRRIELAETYPIISTITDSGDNIENYNLLVSKEGENVFSDNMNDMLLSTKAGQFLVRLSDYKNKSGEFSWQIPHGLGYPPMYLYFFTSGDGYYRGLTGGVDHNSNADSINVNIGMGGVGSGRIAVIIFKDPLV
jgi:hypothetical protein